MPKKRLPEPDLGAVFNRLTVTGPSAKNPNATGYYIPVTCSCGKSMKVKLSRLLKGSTNSCGCGRTDRFRTFATKHGLRFGPVYLVWLEMRQRCSNPKHKQWLDYGGRGISVDPRWDDFSLFNFDMGPKPFEKSSLERRDNEKNYTPKNCCWASRTEQVRNRRNTLFVTYQGCLVGFADLISMVGRDEDYAKLYLRRSRGWDIDLLLSTP